MKTKRILAALLALSALAVGAWAAAFPLSFYGDFPLPGRRWVSLLGPYNEHLVRDVGGLYLALFVITAGAGLRPTDGLLRLLGAGWLLFGLAHLGFHATHLQMFPTTDRITVIASLTGVAGLAAALLLPTTRPGDGWSARPGQLRGAPEQ